MMVTNSTVSLLLQAFVTPSSTSFSTLPLKVVIFWASHKKLGSLYLRLFKARLIDSWAKDHLTNKCKNFLCRLLSLGCFKVNNYYLI